MRKKKKKKKKKKQQKKNKKKNIKTYVSLIVHKEFIYEILKP